MKGGALFVRIWHRARGGGRERKGETILGIGRDWRIMNVGTLLWMWQGSQNRKSHLISG